MKRDKLTVGLLALLAVIACGAVLDAAQSVVLPLVIAWLLSYILGPAISALTRRKVPTGLAVTLILVLLLGVCYLLTMFLHARVSAFAAAYPQYQEKLSDLTATIAARWNLKWNPFAGIDWGEKVGSFLVDLTGSLFSFLSSLLMVFIFLVFLLLGKPYFNYKVKKAFAPLYATRIISILNSIAGEIGRYLSVQFLISLATGILVWLALMFLGVQFAITWGALAFLLNFIPTVGSIIASVPPVLLALVQFHPSYWQAIATLLVLLTIQMSIGNVLAPKVLGDQLNLSPVVVLLSLVFWGWLWGIAGAILSVPIASAVKIVCEHIEPLHPIAVMMGAGKSYRREFERVSPNSE